MPGTRDCRGPQKDVVARRLLPDKAGGFKWKQS
jgi:hypothetical protein